MKRIVYGSIAVIALMATSGAFADTATASPLATKSYVDGGIRYVYDMIQGDGTNLGLAQTKQDKIDSSNKLNADLVDDSTSTNKFVTATDKDNWDAKQAQLKNDAGTPVNISDTVKTTVGAATGQNAATDDALVTEKAVRTAIDNAVLSAGTVSAGAGIDVDPSDNNKVSINGLSASTSGDGKIYVLKNNTATELQVVSNWDPSVLTNP